MPLSAATLSHSMRPWLSARRWWVAYSGGVDSHVLLHLLNQLPDHPPITALHINHQLQDESAGWLEHCQRQTALLNIPLRVVAVNVVCGPRQSLEEQARLARYDAFAQLLEEGDLLLLGHHLDDQAETSLMRLLRGSGSLGAAAMPAQRSLAAGHLLRPLLAVARQDIADYAQAAQLQWIEDPSNQQADVDRNFLRLKVLPLLAQRWPQYRHTLARSAALSAQSAALNKELAAIDLAALFTASRTTSIATSKANLIPTSKTTATDTTTATPVAESLPIAALCDLSEARQKNLLRYWLQCRGLSLPSAAQLQEILDSVVAAKADAMPLLCWGGVDIRRFNGQLYSLASLGVFDRATIHHFTLDSPLTIEGVGTVTMRPSLVGVDSARLVNGSLSIRFRQGGERCRPAGRSASQTLKKLFQQYLLPPWWRDRAPLLYCEDTLIAVADLWVCEGWQQVADRPGLALEWTQV